MFVLSSRRRHTRCALVTGVQTCARPISVLPLDYVQINQLLNASAEAGHAPAILALALMLGSDPDPRAQQIAVQLLGRAAAACDVVGARLLAERPIGRASGRERVCQYG